MLDALCHLDLIQEPVAPILHRAQEAGIKHVILAGVEPQGWRRQQALCERYGALYRTIGLHPWAVIRSSPRELDSALELLEVALSKASTKIVGLGETGLDRSPRLGTGTALKFDAQCRAFRRQLLIAKEHELPLVLHVVRAHGVALEMVREFAPFPKGGMVHSFRGSPELARQWMRQGFDISISPKVINPNAKRLHLTVSTIPSDRLLIETDSPDQLKEPAQLQSVLDAVAEARNSHPNEIAAQTTHNAHRLFGLGPIS